MLVQQASTNRDAFHSGFEGTDYSWVQINYTQPCATHCCSHFFHAIYRLELSLPLSLAMPSTPLAAPARGVSATLAPTLNSALPVHGDQTATSTLFCFLNFNFAGPVRVVAEEVWRKSILCLYSC